MAHRLTPEDKQYILKRHQEGASLRAIGREIGRPDITVRRVLEAQAITFGLPKTTNQRTSPETEALVLRLYDQGCTWREINEQADVTSRTLGKILERNGAGTTANQTPRPTPRPSRLSTRPATAREPSARCSATARPRSAVSSSATAADAAAPGCEHPDYFERIDTPEKAYWLGFISADGCIIATAKYPEGSHLAVQLAVRDKGHLVKLKAALGAHAGVSRGPRASGSRPAGAASPSDRAGSPRRW